MLEDIGQQSCRDRSTIVDAGCSPSAPGMTVGWEPYLPPHRGLTGRPHLAERPELSSASPPERSAVPPDRSTPQGRMGRSSSGSTRVCWKRIRTIDAPHRPDQGSKSSILRAAARFSDPGGTRRHADPSHAVSGQSTDASYSGCRRRYAAMNGHSGTMRSPRATASSSTNFASRLPRPRPSNSGRMIVWVKTIRPGSRRNCEVPARLPSTVRS